MEHTTKRLSLWAAFVAFLLLIPLIGMQFSADVNWGFFDFVFMGALLFGAGLVYELVSKRMRSGTYRVATLIFVATSVLLVWINAAVGIIGDGPVNVLYAGVLFVGLIGATMARFEPRGMFRTLCAMAGVQFLVPMVALALWKLEVSFEPSVIGVFGINTFFVTMFIISAVLFHQAEATASQK